MSNEINQRMAKGQALNLAVSDALASNKGQDTRYILTQYIRYYSLSNLVQSASIEEIKEELK